MQFYWRGDFSLCGVAKTIRSGIFPNEVLHGDAKNQVKLLLSPY
jgi:hypothetical protein